MAQSDVERKTAKLFEPEGRVFVCRAMWRNSRGYTGRRQELRRMPDAPVKLPPLIAFVGKNKRLPRHGDALLALTKVQVVTV